MATVRALGVANAAALLTLSALSPLLSLVKPLSIPDGRVPFFWELSKSLPLLGSLLPTQLQGSGLLARADLFLLGYGLPVLTSTVIAIALLVILHRRRQVLGPDTTRLLFRFAVVFAGVSALCVPILADDFFLPLGWGRMILEGLNPYYEKLPLALGAGTPFEHVPWRNYNPYGPLWALVSAAVALLSAGHALVGLILFKGIIAGAWIGSLALVRSIMAGRPTWEQCTAIVVFGWLPLGPTQIVGDGHNDAVLILFVLLWVRGLQRGDTVAPALWLAAAVAVKFVAAPLFLLDILHRLRERGEPLGQALRPAAWAALPLLLLFAVFHVGHDPLVYLRAYPLLRYRFHTTEVALEGLEALSGIGLGPLPALSRLILPAIALTLLGRYLRRPEPWGFRLAALGILAAVLFGVSSFIWPWYLPWLLALAAVVPGSALSRWVVAVALLAPALVLPVNAFPGSGGFWVGQLPDVVWYASALALFFALRGILSGDTPDLVSPAGGGLPASQRSDRI